jgi:hypothetical protein
MIPGENVDVNLVITQIVNFFHAIWNGITGIVGLTVISRAEPKTPPKNYFFSSAELEKFAKFALTFDGQSDVYMGLGVGDMTPARGARFKETDVRWIACLWVDVDFDQINADHAKAREIVRARLAALGFPPSAIVFSGGGWHLYWLLRTPASGGDLARVKALNKALAERLLGDHAWDLARVLRVPNTMNMKPKRNGARCAIEELDPLRAYTLDDAESALAVKQAGPAPQPTPEPAGGDADVDADGPIDIATLGISEDAKSVILGGLPAYLTMLQRRLTPAAYEERRAKHQLSRSEADAWVISQLIGIGITDEQIYAIYSDPKNQCGEKYREKKGGDKYLGTTIKNCREFRESHPKTPPDVAAITIGARVEKKFADAKLEVVKIRKILYESPYYAITLRILETGDEMTTDARGDTVTDYWRFRKAFFHAHRNWPPEMPQATWEEMLSAAPCEVVQVQEEIAGPRGAIVAHLAEFLSKAQPKTRQSASSIQQIPLRDEDGTVMFKLQAFLTFLTKVDVDRQDVIDVLRERHWRNENRRFGREVVHVWWLELTPEVPLDPGPDADGEKSGGDPDGAPLPF